MARTTEKPATPGPVTVRRAWLWPVAIILALALVVAVNATFIWIAVTGADPLAPSYVDGER